MEQTVVHPFVSGMRNLTNDYLRVTMQEVDFKTLSCKIEGPYWAQMPGLVVVWYESSFTFSVFYTKWMNRGNMIYTRFVKSFLERVFAETAQRVFTARSHFLEAQKGTLARVLNVKRDFDFLSDGSMGAIRLGAKLLCLSEEIIDRVIFYEAARLKYRKNTKQFWAYLSALLGVSVDADRWKESVGRRLDECVKRFDFLHRIFLMDKGMLRDPKVLTNLNNDYLCFKVDEVDWPTLTSKTLCCNQYDEIYWGKDHRCQAIVEHDDTGLHLFYSDIDDWKSLQLQSWLREIVKRTLLRVAQKVILARFHYWETQKGLKAACVGIRFMTKGYGECSETGSIVLNPILLYHQMDAMDETILHELAHLKYCHHRKSFWKYLSEPMRREPKSIYSWDLNNHAEDDVKTLFYYIFGAKW